MLELFVHKKMHCVALASDWWFSISRRFPVSWYSGNEIFTASYKKIIWHNPLSLYFAENHSERNFTLLSNIQIITLRTRAKTMFGLPWPFRVFFIWKVDITELFVNDQCVPLLEKIKRRFLISISVLFIKYQRNLSKADSV